MSQITRRTLMKVAGAAATASVLGARVAHAEDKVKIGFIFLGPIGDYGWTWAHNKGREAVDAALGDKVETVYVENVAEDASAIPVIRDLAQQGCKLIFTTSYGYMEQTLEVATASGQLVQVDQTAASGVGHNRGGPVNEAAEREQRVVAVLNLGVHLYDALS